MSAYPLVDQHNADVFKEFGAAAADFIQREVLVSSPNSEKDSKDIVDVINAISATGLGREILGYWIIAQETLEWGCDADPMPPWHLWDGERG